MQIHYIYLVIYIYLMVVLAFVNENLHFPAALTIRQTNMTQDVLIYCIHSY